MTNPTDEQLARSLVIVNRLRRAARGQKEVGAWPELYTAAADEIEQLSSDLKAAQELIVKAYLKARGEGK